MQKSSFQGFCSPGFFPSCLEDHRALHFRSHQGGSNRGDPVLGALAPPLGGQQAPTFIHCSNKSGLDS
eukprot:236533-Amphidinium_carterae.1